MVCNAIDFGPTTAHPISTLNAVQGSGISLSATAANERIPDPWRPGGNYTARQQFHINNAESATRPRRTESLDDEFTNGPSGARPDLWVDFHDASNSPQLSRPASSLQSTTLGADVNSSPLWTPASTLLQIASNPSSTSHYTSSLASNPLQTTALQRLDRLQRRLADLGRVRTAEMIEQQQQQPQLHQITSNSAGVPLIHRLLYDLVHVGDPLQASADDYDASINEPSQLNRTSVGQRGRDEPVDRLVEMRRRMRRDYWTATSGLRIFNRDQQRPS